jgi:putative ABC transport system permease protein
LKTDHWERGHDMIIPRLAIKSLANRRATAILTIFSIALSVFLLLGVEKLRSGVKQSFLQTVSGTDLVVGPRTSGTHLLLYSIFHIGNASNNVTLKTLYELKKRREVSWLVPISLGDSHRGFRLVGTTGDYFDRIRTPGNRLLQFDTGARFAKGLQAVIGSDVAQKLGYETGDQIVVSHGLGEVSFISHEREKFVIVGILSKTATPIDKTVIISLQSIEALHHDWLPGQNQLAENTTTDKPIEPLVATAALVGLNSKIAILGFQRYVNQYSREPLSAVIPGVAFVEIWQLVSRVEVVLFVVAALVAVTAIVGMIITILASVNERRREMAILRSIGAGPVRILWLFVAEAVVLSFLGLIVGAGSIYFGLWIMQDAITQFAGIYVPITAPSWNEAIFVSAIFAGALIGGIVPAIRAYQISLTEGLAMRL